MIKFRSNGILLKHLVETFEIIMEENQKKMLKRLSKEENVSYENYQTILNDVKRKGVPLDKNTTVNQELFEELKKIVNKIKDIYFENLLEYNSKALDHLPRKTLLCYDDGEKIDLINSFYKNILRGCADKSIRQLGYGIESYNLDKYIEILKKKLNEENFYFLKDKENIYKSINNIYNKKTGFYSIVEITNEIRDKKNLSLEEAKDIFIYLTLISIDLDLNKKLAIVDNKDMLVGETYRNRVNSAFHDCEELNNLIAFDPGNNQKIEELYEKESIIQYIKGYLYSSYLKKIDKKKEALDKYIEVIQKVAQFDYYYLEQSIRDAFILARSLNDKRDRKIFDYGSYYGLVTGTLEDNTWLREHYNKDFDFVLMDKEIQNCDDLRSPNAKYMYEGRKRTRLEIYSMAVSDIVEKSEEELQKSMIKLIEKGADVNWVNSTGETPLILALCKHNWDRALLLLKYPEIRKSINQCSLRKRNTALSVLINTFQDYPNISCIPKVKEIFYKILEYSPDLDMKCGLDNVSYLRYLMGYLHTKRSHTLTEEKVKNNIEDFRRLGTPFNGITDREIIDYYTGKQFEGYSNFKQIREKIISTIISVHEEPNFKEFIYELITAILKKGADVNARDKNVSALMYAAEIGDLRLLKILEEYGADMHEEGYSSKGIWYNLYVTALFWKQDAIVNYVQMRYPDIADSKNIEKFIISQYNKFIKVAGPWENKNLPQWIKDKLFETYIEKIMPQLLHINRYVPSFITRENLKQILQR